MLYIRLALAIDVLLTAIEHLLQTITNGFLPLGGDPFIQLSVLLLLGVSITELLSLRKGRE
jgi:hypothetical protein